MKITPFFWQGEGTRCTRLRYFSVRSSNEERALISTILRKNRDCKQSRVAQWRERCPVVSLQVVSQRLQFAAKRPVSLRALACHRRGLGSNPRSDSICKLSLLLVPTLAPRAILWFSLLFLKKKTFHLGKKNAMFTAHV